MAFPVDTLIRDKKNPLPHERRILETFIKEGVKLEGFSTITSRLKNWDKKHIEDLELIEEATKKLKALNE